jgi:hypothetical protein
MAAGLGFKTFNTGDVLSAADTNGYLMQGVLVFADAAARTAAITSPQEGQMSFLKDTNSTEYYSGSAWVAVGGGGGGKVLQVVQATYSTATSNSTTTYADTGLSLSITPSATSSKVLVLTMTPARKASGNSDNGLWIRIVRGATSVLESGYALFTGDADALFGVVSQHYLDSPSTTSATTYKTQFRNNTAAASVDVQFNAQTSTIILMEIGA